MYCPNCQSTKIFLSASIEDEYFCENCQTKFYLKVNKKEVQEVQEEDSSEGGGQSANGGNSIPLSLWLQCWQLHQQQHSIENIVKITGLPVNAIKIMIVHMTKMFSENDLVSRQKVSKENFNTLHMMAKKSPSITKNQELLGKQAIGQAQDTAEERKLKNRRLNPNK